MIFSLQINLEWEENQSQINERIDQTLKYSNPRENCPSAQELGESITNKFFDCSNQDLYTHIQSCKFCQEELLFFQKFLNL